MRYSTHLVFAGCCYSLMAKAGLPSHDGLGLATAMAASMLPDLDCPGSYIGRKLPFISRPLGMLLGHRGFSHSLLCTVLVGAVFSYATHAELSLLAAVAIGYLSHILGDYLCDSGIPLWWPKKERISFPYAIRTGSAAERTLAGALLILLFWLSGLLPFGFNAIR
jgi:inner membrane protein